MDLTMPPMSENFYSAFNKQQRDAIDERLKDIILMNAEGLLALHDFDKPPETVEIQLTPAWEIQHQRSQLQKKIFDAEDHVFDQDENHRTDAENFKAELDKLPKVVDNEAIQTILDCFDYWEVEEACRKLNYRYNYASDNHEGEPITVEKVIKDALRAFKDLKEWYDDKPCGKVTVGRLIATKLTVDEDVEYNLYFQIESFSEYVEND